MTDLKTLINRSKNIRQLFRKYEKKKYGREWTTSAVAQGFAGDVGDLQKLVMAKNGLRQIDNVDNKLAHELADCLWSVLILADENEVDLETAFNKTMDELEEMLKRELA